MERSLARHAASLAAALLTLASCATSSYRPPVSPAEPGTSVVVEASYDETWSRLIDLLSVSFYSIELLDRDSGFIRLDFSSDVWSGYVDCGEVTKGATSAPYVQDLADRGIDQLRARMNVYVRPIDDTHTMVRAHARYVLGAYVFESGGSASKRIAMSGGKSRTVTCQPTYEAEGHILQWASAEPQD